MKKPTKRVTLQTLDKKIDTLGQTLDKKISTLVTTVDNLAVATKKGFDEVKEEITDFEVEMTDFKKKTEMTLFNMDNKLHTVDQRLDAIEKTLGPLVQVSSAVQHEIRELNLRVVKLEHHAGIK